MSCSSCSSSIAAYKTVLVTGGCGFVGRHFVKRLVGLGKDVVVVDNLSSSSALHPDYWPSHLKCAFTFLDMDVSVFFVTHTHISYDLVIHLAAIVEGREKIEQQPLAVAEDLAIDAHFFKWVSGVQPLPMKVVYFSSSAAYPTVLQTDHSPQALREDMSDVMSDWIGLPDMTYGWSKLTGEYLARLAHSTHGLNIVCYRPFSGYGEDQHCSYPFPAILRRVASGKRDIEIWSDCVRDFVYIEDVVDCVLKTMGTVIDGSPLNIGTGIATSFSELVRTMIDVSGRSIHDVNIHIATGKPKGVHYRVADTVRLSEHGYVTSTSLREGIDKCMCYLKKTT